MPNAAPGGAAPRLFVAATLRPLVAPPSASAVTCTAPGSPLTPSAQSGEFSDEMNPGDRFTKGSSAKSHTLAREEPELTGGKLEELSLVKFVPSKRIT